jgi:methyltransferase family protein
MWGDRYAEVYDDFLATSEIETGPAVDFLAELAGAGPALELGIGSGRLALPLAARGVELHGIDASERMVARLRAEPGGAAIPVAIGDLADVADEGSFRLIYAAFYAFFALFTEEDQLRCLRNVAARLAAGGVFVLEAYVPEVRSGPSGESFSIASLEPDRVMVSFSRHDAVTQTIDSVEVWITEQGIRLFPSRDRPISPGELDLMAAQAGLALRERWAGWRREPFTEDSKRHVSVYELKPDAAAVEA